MTTHKENCLKPIDNDNENDPDFNKVHCLQKVFSPFAMHEVKLPKIQVMCMGQGQTFICKKWDI